MEKNFASIFINIMGYISQQLKLLNPLQTPYKLVYRTFISKFPTQINSESVEHVFEQKGVKFVSRGNFKNVVS